MSDVAKAIVEAILDDLTDRKGLRQTWEAIDSETQEEIMATWERLIDLNLVTPNAAQP